MAVDVASSPLHFLDSASAIFLLRLRRLALVVRQPFLGILQQDDDCMWLLLNEHEMQRHYSFIIP